MKTLLQLLESNNEQSENRCNLSCWYRSLFCSSGSSLIKYSFSSPQGYLYPSKSALSFLTIRILDIQSDPITSPSIDPFTLEFAVWSFIYTFQIIKSAQIQVTIINNCIMSRLHTLHKVINCNYLTFKNPSLTDLTR